MKYHLKGVLKVLGDYAILFFVFLFFSYPFLKHLKVYSFVVFLFMTMILYSDMHNLAQKEKRPQYNMKPYPLKGFVLGAIGYLPLLVIILIYPFVNVDTTAVNFGNLKHVIRNAFMGPLFFFAKIGNETTQAYLLAWLIAPIITMLGYMAGLYGVEISPFIRKVLKLNPPSPKKTVKHKKGIL